MQNRAVKNMRYRRLSIIHQQIGTSSPKREIRQRLPNSRVARIERYQSFHLSGAATEFERRSVIATQSPF